MDETTQTKLPKLPPIVDRDPGVRRLCLWGADWTEAPVEAGSFSVPHTLIDDTHLTNVSKLVFIALCRLSDPSEAGQPVPDLAKVAVLSLCSNRRKFHKALNELEERGWISWRKRSDLTAPRSLLVKI